MDLQHVFHRFPSFLEVLSSILAAPTGRGLHGRLPVAPAATARLRARGGPPLGAGGAEGHDAGARRELRHRPAHGGRAPGPRHAVHAAIDLADKGGELLERPSARELPAGVEALVAFTSRLGCL